MSRMSIRMMVGAAVVFPFRRTGLAACRIFVFPLIAAAILATGGPPAQAQTWAKTYGGLNDDVANSIIQTSDGGFAVAGYTFSFGAGGYDLWILKLTSAGDIQWQKTYGGGGYEFANSIVQTSDAGFAVAGYTWNPGYSSQDFWVLKLNSDGGVQWQWTYGGVGNDVVDA